MTIRKRALKTLGSLCLALAAPMAMAGYLQWEVVTLGPETGAACGDGSPYRFFVNKTPDSHDLVMEYEGGGACWTQEACLGQGPLSASNPNGIPPNYLHELNDSAFGLITPFNARHDPFQAVQTQSWNIVYLPYCTGDVHSGNKIAVYSDSDPSNPRVEYHYGANNIAAAAAWIRANMGQPANLLLTGFSAGGVGSTTTYPMVRQALQPTGKVSLLADSGPLMPAPRSGTPEQYPSLPLHNQIRSAWGLDDPDGLITKFAGMPGFDTNDLGTVNRALSMSYPDDRFGFMAFQADGTFSQFSYDDFYPDISNAPNQKAKTEAIYSRWQLDIGHWMNDLAQYDNVSYHLPFFRNFNASHCLTIIDFSGTGIEEDNIPDIGPFVDNTLDRGTPMRTYETDHFSDFFRPLSPAIRFVKLVEKIFM